MEINVSPCFVRKAQRLEESKILFHIIEFPPFLTQFMGVAVEGKYCMSQYLLPPLVEARGFMDVCCPQCRHFHPLRHNRGSSPTQIPDRHMWNPTNVQAYSCSVIY